MSARAILFIGDLHCQFELVNLQIEHAQRHGATVDAVVLPGDLGLFEPGLGRYFRRDGKRFLRPTFYVEGNHEDFTLIRTLVDRYADVMTYLPRGSVHRIGRWRCLGMGGASYMDPAATPPGSVIDRDDIQRSLAHEPEAVDLVISHDCPTGLDLPHAPGFEHYGPVGFEGSQMILQRYRPAFWVFGHHHRVVDVSLAGTRCIGLPQAWCGYGLLDADGRYEFVRHHIARPPSAWQRLRAKLGLGRV